jgi:hypothetical protein
MTDSLQKNAAIRREAMCTESLGRIPKDFDLAR